MERVFKIPGQGKLELLWEETGLTVTVEDYGTGERGSTVLRMRELGMLAGWMAGLEDAVFFRYKEKRLSFKWLPEKAGFRVFYEEYDESGNRLRRAGVAPKGLIALKILHTLEDFLKNSEVVYTSDDKLITKTKGMLMVNDHASGEQTILSPPRMEELRLLIRSVGKIKDLLYDHRGISYNGKLSVDGIAFSDEEIRVLKLLL